MAHTPEALPMRSSWDSSWTFGKGDVHFYDMAPERDAWDPALFPRAKFVSEFGFQSFASFPAFANQSAPGDWSRNSSMVGFRRAPPVASGHATVYISQKLI